MCYESSEMQRSCGRREMFSMRKKNFMKLSSFITNRCIRGNDHFTDLGLDRTNCLSYCIILQLTWQCSCLSYSCTLKLDRWSTENREHASQYCYKQRSVSTGSRIETRLPYLVMHEIDLSNMPNGIPPRS